MSHLRAFEQLSGCELAELMDVGICQKMTDQGVRGVTFDKRNGEKIGTVHQFWDWKRANPARVEEARARWARRDPSELASATAVEGKTP